MKCTTESIVYIIIICKLHAIVYQNNSFVMIIITRKSRTQVKCHDKIIVLYTP